MSNNGRRRWRKWARLMKMGRDSNARFEVFRRHRDTTFMGCELCPPPIPAKPFTPRSLVGMTMGARKRYARQSRALSFARNHPHLMKPGAFERGRGSLRIGERLRPCPGCRDCTSVWTDTENYRWSVAKRGHLCGGSGVLPARVREAAP